MIEALEQRKYRENSLSHTDRRQHLHDPASLWSVMTDTAAPSADSNSAHDALKHPVRREPDTISLTLKKVRTAMLLALFFSPSLRLSRTCTHTRTRSVLTVSCSLLGRPTTAHIHPAHYCSHHYRKRPMHAPHRGDLVEHIRERRTAAHHASRSWPPPLAASFIRRRRLHHGGHTATLNWSQIAQRFRASTRLHIRSPRAWRHPLAT